MKIRKVDSLYSEDQLQRYLERIGWTGSRPQPTHNDLRRLQRLHICSIPFSNAFIIYEKNYVDLEPQALFDRLVTRHGGFFCFGQNLLFREMLRAVGFRCYSSIARVNQTRTESDEITLEGMSHMVVMVCLTDDQALQDEDHLWLVDVGFGGGALTQPLALHLGQVQEGTFDSRHRLGLAYLKKSSIEVNADQKGILLRGLPPIGAELALESQIDARDGNHDSQPWRAAYCFQMTECWSNDYALSHYGICHQHKLFTDNVIMARFLHDESSDQMGIATLFNNQLKIQKVGMPSEKREVKTEKERISVLRDHFGLRDLPEDAIENIRRKGVQGLALA